MTTTTTSTSTITSTTTTLTSSTTTTTSSTSTSTITSSTTSTSTTTTAPVPDVDWVVRAGGPGSDYGEHVNVLRSGTVLVSGEFGMCCDLPGTFGSTTLRSVSAEGKLVFDMEVSREGQIETAVRGSTQRFRDLRRDRTIHGVDLSCNSRVRDGHGNVYEVGRFRGNKDFGSSSLSSRGQGDIYVLKKNGQGEEEWIGSFGGEEDDTGNFVAISAEGHPHVVGHFSGMAAFGSEELHSQGFSDAFVAKLDKTFGNVTWVFQIEGNGVVAAHGAVVSAAGGVYVTGSYNGAAQFGNFELISKGGRDVFVLLLDSTGTLLWATSVGGPGNDVGRAVAIDEDAGAIYVTGS
eukprot:CAMPEP_0180461610 /NCGR_PEP_ID=MMETSP1036_2-20121128/23970_1 /TAXON_ID=632150 /ORGANISM="Azadinium spinosum, Strain 3D9" /LENGTH=347 /DNA_ID=CAMNT_0022468341 /DNA_START=254 /DNA_END=1293 /DNA_ORIENTATION=-